MPFLVQLYYSHIFLRKLNHLYILKIRSSRPFYVVNIVVFLDQCFHSKFDLKVIFIMPYIVYLSFQYFSFHVAKNLNWEWMKRAFIMKKSENALKMSTWLCF